MLAGMQAPDVEGCGPPVARDAEWGDPWIRPARDERLPDRMAGGVMGEAPRGTGLGIAARPDSAIDGGDRLPGREGRAGKQGAHGGGGDRAVDEGGVEAAPATTMHGLKAEREGRGHGVRDEQGSGQFEQSSGAAREAGVEVGTEVLDTDEGG